MTYDIKISISDKSFWGRDNFRKYIISVRHLSKDEKRYDWTLTSGAFTLNGAKRKAEKIAQTHFNVTNLSYRFSPDPEVQSKIMEKKLELSA